METVEDPFPLKNFYLYQSKISDPVDAFEKLTNFKIDRNNVGTIPIAELENDAKNPKEAPKSWWNSFWQDGWSHLTFGTLSMGAGTGSLVAANGVFLVATGPLGWTTAAILLGGGMLGLIGGSLSTITGGAKFLATRAEDRKALTVLGDAALSLNNIPGFTAGTATYMLTQDHQRSIDHAAIAGLIGGAASVAKSGYNALKMLRAYSLEVGPYLTKYSSRTRRIAANLMEINPKGLEASHFVPQRVIKKLVELFPKQKRAIELLLNSPLNIRFMTATEHALVDSSRFKTLLPPQKEALAVIHPIRAMLLDNYRSIADIIGIRQNLPPTLVPFVDSLLLTSGRLIRMDANSCEK